MSEYVVEGHPQVERIKYEVTGSHKFIRDVKLVLRDGSEVDAIAYGDRVESRFQIDNQTITVDGIGSFGLYIDATGRNPCQGS